MYVCKKSGMRSIVIFFIAVIACSACMNSEKKQGPTANTAYAPMDSTKFTTIQWLDSTSRDFGKIAEGKKLEVSYRFKNTGDKPLIIQKVQPSCGCTIAEQPTEPVLPGDEGTIKAAFNSENHVGVNHKTLYVYANTKGGQAHELQFNVEVQKKKW